MSDQDKKLNSLYKAAATQMPSEALDQQILALAKAQCSDEKIRAPYSMRKYLPYSVAASVVFVALLVTNYPQYYLPSPEHQPSHPELIEAEPVAPDTAMPEIKAEPAASLQYIDKTPMVTSKSQQRAKAVALKPNSPQAKSLNEDNGNQTLLLEQITKAIKTDNKAQALLYIERYIEQFGYQGLPPVVQQYYQRHSKAPQSKP